MSVDPVSPIVAATAGTPMAQTDGADAARMRQAAIEAKRRVAAEKRSASAAGISPADGQNLATNDRDPDGRHGWVVSDASESDPHNVSPADSLAENRDEKSSETADERGRRIDLVG
jgi:hypothetical protein